MTPEERSLLSDLFRNLREAESQPRDPEAERFIEELVRAQPASPYYLSQSVLVQQQALAAARQRVDDLERQLKDAQARASSANGAAGGGSFLSNALGLGRGPWGSRSEGVPPAQPPAARGPWGAPPPRTGYDQQGYGQPSYPPAPTGYPQSGAYAQPGGYAQPAGFASRGGGFLGGAVQTAAGVAGGILAAEAISSLLHHSPGPFGSAMAGPMAGGLGGGMGGGETIINNFYGDAGRPDDGPVARDANYQPDDAGAAPDDRDQDTTVADNATYDDGGDDGGDGWA